MSVSKAVFLSYASQDAGVAKKICDAMRRAGVEVWFDLNELRGGDGWDQRIRKQIKECAFFVPLISAQTNARLEGYYRLEWKLAIDRSHLMAEEKPFLLPVVIDDTVEATAKVPDRFRDFQWTRLRLDETPVQFGARVQALLRASEVERGRPRPALRGEGAASPAKPKNAKKPTPVWIWLGLTLLGVAASLALAIWQPWRNAAPPANPPPGTTPPAAAAANPPAPVSEARLMLAKAKALYEPWDGATREDFALAEQFMKRALALDATDGEVWAGYALLTCGQIVLGHDTSPARIETARIAAERAIKLAPDSTPARFAQAFYFRFQGSTRADSERLLRELVELAPDDRLILRTYAAVLRGRGKFDEALSFLDRAAALPGGDPVALYNKFVTLSAALRFTEAEAVIDEALALRPMPYLFRAKATCLTLFHGDLDGAAEVIAKVPGPYLLEDSGAYWASQIWLWRRNADKCLAVWRAVPRDLIEASDFRGPKAFIVGQAHRIAGRPAAAQAEWTAALRIVEQQLAAQPNAVQWVYWKARLLAVLERPVEAEEVLRTFEQLTGAKGLVNDTIPIYLLLGRRADVLEALEKAHAALVARGNPSLVSQFENNLRLNVEWDLLRDHARFAKLSGGAKSP